MKPYRYLCVICIVVLVAASSEPGLAAADEELKITITVREKGTELTMRKGEDLELKMESNASTGYSWQIAKNKSELLKPIGEPTFERRKDAKPGSSALQVFRFQAIAKGTSELELHYRRPFGKDKPPARTYKVAIRIVDSAGK